MITTHILDTSLGRPAAGVRVRLEKLDGGAFRLLGEGQTDDDGRLRTLLPADAPIEVGTYRLRFEIGEYHGALGVAGFFPYVEIVFAMSMAGGHVHVPLLLSPYGYSTYRGS